MKKNIINKELVANNNFNVYKLITKIIRFHSFRNKVFIIAFVGTHIPLIAIIGYILYSSKQLSALSVFALALISTLVGTLLVLWSLHHLLKPITLVNLALKNYLEKGEVTSIPEDLDGKMGSLLRNLNYALTHIEDRRQLLEAIAVNDPLTGLGNRLYAQQQLKEISVLTDKQTPDLCIAMLDIDHFKKINDLYGHAVGDEVLTNAAVTMKSILKRDSDWIARWGGEEFLIVLNCSLTDAETILNKMRLALASCIIKNNQNTINYTVSMGLTQVKPNEAIKQSIERADNALYRAKQSGRNQLITQI